MNKWLKRIVLIPKLLAAVNDLRRDIEAALKLEGVKAAWERFKQDPEVAKVTPQVGEGWRRVEELLRAIK